MPKPTKPSPKAKPIQLRGDNGEMFNSAEHEVIIAGPADCVAWDTEIETKDGLKAIGWLYENQVAPIVRTLYGWKRAKIPFCKGVAKLYEVELSNGQSFKATAGHWILSLNGFEPLDSLHVQQVLPGYVFCHPQSISERARSIRAGDGPSFVGTVRDSIGGCPAYYHSYDEQLLREEVIGLLTALLQNDVLKRNSRVSFEGDLEDKYEHSHPCQSFDLRAIWNYLCRRTPLGMALSSHEPLGIREHECEWFQLEHQSRLEFPLLPPLQRRERDFQNKQIFSYPDHKLIQLKVQAIKDIGEGSFYDIQVPDADHYFAAGCIHHNTGKTVGTCVKAHMICMSVPNVQGAIVRKTNVSLAGTVLKTFQRIIAGAGVRTYGGETPSRFIYPNGSVVWCGGMDNPDSILSSERDFILGCQLEEFTLNDWEMLGTRCTGRGAVIQFPQLFGDCNPGGAQHWIRKRAEEGTLRLLNARHTDNPSLFDSDGVITEDGKIRIGLLENLTGVRRKRLLEGIWATAEGAVFDTFDKGKHVIRRDPKEMKRWFLCIDEGTTNPCAIGLCGDDSDGRRHLFQEFYKTQQRPAYIVEIAKEWYHKFKCELAAVDDAAPGLILDLRASPNGINAKGGKGRIIDGINKLQDRLAIVKADDRPRFTIDPDCLNTINEFESHVWTKDKPKDVPVDADNHMIAALRYLEDVLAVPTGAITDPDAIRIGARGHGGFRMPVYKGMRL